MRAKICPRCSRSTNRNDDDPFCETCSVEVEYLQDMGLYCTDCMDDVRNCSHWTADHAICEEMDRLVHPEDEHFSRPESPVY